MRTAVVIGSTGLIGEQLVRQLAQQGSWTSVLAVSRKSKTWANPKIRTLVFDFKNWGDLELQVRSFAGNTSLDFFCALGTTMKVAGSEDAFRAVDFDAVISYAELAQSCRGEQLLIVSSLGAAVGSGTFYLKVKGEMEKAAQQKFSGKTYFLRPSLLLGDRTEFRFFERLSMLAAPVASVFLQGKLAKYKPIRAQQVAKVMVLVASRNKSAPPFIENNLIHDLTR